LVFKNNYNQAWVLNGLKNWNQYWFLSDSKN
jgi:hypothetical protein